MFKKILWVLFILLVVIQFIHPKKNKSEGPQPHFIGNAFVIPDNVNQIMSKACNHCHSNNSTYPWYSNFQPIHWWMNKHNKDGKKNINFDEYTNRSLRYQFHKMEEMEEMIKESKMPLDSYTWTHKDARLTVEEKNILITWATANRDAMKAKHPIDSLIKKKQ